MNPKGPLHIALDYDGTYTADRELWDKFIELAQGRGHTVTILTMRYDNLEEMVKEPPCEVIYTGRKAKRNFYLADIWIDDKPHLILSDSMHE
jgi:hypothetical protein